ncbi:MAG: DNA mismatch repair protein MutS [Clostridia bacterium]|nr:DNA mismatch repair protein MutS [Clostridia bacterium]
MAEMSPMIKQYLEIKAQNPDALLFFRLGDFYELFFDDAKLVSKELDLTLTGKICGMEERAPMCGVPFHAYESYAARLVDKGYKVAICEQLEDPATTKGLVKRGVIRIITAGTIIENAMLDESRNNYICAICSQEGTIGLCVADVSTGELNVTQLTGGNAIQKLCGELGKFEPHEILINSATLSLGGLDKFIKNRLNASLELLDDDRFDYDHTLATVNVQFTKQEIDDSHILTYPVTVMAIGALINYIYATQLAGEAEEHPEKAARIDCFDHIHYYVGDIYMNIDVSTRRNLELTETMRTKSKKGSLLWVLDKTKTPMGKRMIRSIIERPLVNPVQIQARQNAVEELCGDAVLRDEIVQALRSISDIERLITRIVYGSANAREIRSLAYAAESLPAVKNAVKSMKSGEIKHIFKSIDTLSDIRDLVERAIVDEPPLTVREGGMIKPGYCKDLDVLQSDMSGGKEFIASIEEQERKRTGIQRLKVGYNRVFGYYIEVSNASKDLVPKHYIRKQTLANCERYITEELKEMEGRVLGARDRIVKLEYELFEDIRKQVAACQNRVQQTADAIARLDVWCSFAEVAVHNNYTRPLVNTSGKIVLKDSRHPVVEAVSEEQFVPNDVYLDNRDNRVAIITGPNMAGKSTYMRQVAIITLMAQCGSFVPVSSAEIGVVDSIFTRVGASDDLASGQSTFMVEMNEVAYILENATADSLLILDEIGRGTSTFDGMSIARAVLEFVADKKKLGAKALFATHYHELTELENTLKGVRNYSVAVKKRGDDITFLRRIVSGGADQSYGIEVAKLAGIPDAVVKRARQILKQLESGKPEISQKKAAVEQTAISFTPPGEAEAVFRLKQLDINNLTPMQSFQILGELAELVK